MKKKSIYPSLFLLLLLFLHLLLLSNLQFTAWPEMFSFPYMIDKGFILYKDFHHVYPPLLTYMLLGVFNVFGYKLITLKLFTYVIVILIDLMVFLNVKKITKDNKLSLVALSLFVLLQPIFEGNMLWHDIFVMLPILISIYFVDTNLILSGLFISISFLIKQQYAVLALPVFVYLLLTKIKLKNILQFIFGCTIPVIVLVVFLYKYNIFSDYFFWNFEFPIIQLPKIPGYAQYPIPRDIKILGLMLTTLLLGISFNYKKLKSKFYLLMVIMFLLVLSAFPRFSLFHLQPALVVYVLLLGYLLKFKNKFYLLLLTIPAIVLWKNVLVTANYEDRFYGDQELNFASEIKNRVKNDKVFLLGPNSLIYVLSDTVPPKPWIENYVWHFEISGIQEKVIEGWKIDPPKFIFWTKPKQGNWHDLATYQPEKIVKYIIANYEKIDEVDNAEIWELII